MGWHAMKKNKGFWYRLLKATFARRTLLRFLQNEAVLDMQLKGDILDLGGNSKSQYYKYLNISDDSNLTYADKYDKSNNVINMDFTRPFPIKDKQYDYVLLMNVIEHLSDYDLCLAETKRVLRKEGRLTGVVPFLFPVHMVPDDFRRPTESSLYLSLKNAGFSTIEVIAIGEGRWVAAANLCGQRIKFKPLTLLMYLAAFFLDGIDKETTKVVKGRIAFPLGYLFKAQ